MLNRLALRTGLVAKLLQQTFRSRNGQNLMQKRLASGYTSYREITYDPYRRIVKKVTDFSMGMVWWWILWNMWHDWRHLVGEYIWPEQSEWSDEHLGIPPDDYD